MKKLPAGQFRAHCLEAIDQVLNSSEAVVVTKRGRPVVKLVPVREDAEELFGFVVGKARIGGDIIHTVPAADWEPR